LIGPAPQSQTPSGFCRPRASRANASEVKRHLAKRASALIVWAEVEEAKLATGEKLDVQTYTTAVNALRRLLGDLGLERAARDATPPLADYLAAKAEGADP